MPDNPITEIHKIDLQDIAGKITIPNDKDHDGLPDNLEVLKDPQKVIYSAKKGSRVEKIFDFIKKETDAGLNTLAGKNKAGKDLANVKDLISLVFPVLEPIDAVSDEIGNLIKSKRTESGSTTNNTIMETFIEKIIRFIKQPSTQAGLSFVIMVIGGLFAGVHIDAPTLTTSIVGILTAIAGVYTAIMNLINIFHDEAKSKAA